jgi:hypothetical protein
MRPHRDVELPLAYGVAYDCVLEEIALTLGANVYVDDRKNGTIEAGFGLVRSERIRCTLEHVSDVMTKVRVEAFFPAGASIPEKSAAVDALAHALSSQLRA